MTEHVAKRHPVLLHQYDEALEGAVVWIQAKLTQGADLTGTIPTIRAVYENMRVVDADLTSDQTLAAQDQRDVFEPLALCEKILVRANVGVVSMSECLEDFVERLPHAMDVCNTKVFLGRIFVELHVLRAHSRGLVGDSIDLWAGVNDEVSLLSSIDLVRGLTRSTLCASRSGFCRTCALLHVRIKQLAIGIKEGHSGARYWSGCREDGCDQAFILRISLVLEHATLRLRASGDGAVVDGMQVSQGGDAVAGTVFFSMLEDVVRH